MTARFPSFAAWIPRAASMGAALFFLGAAGCVRTEQARKPAAQASLVITRGQGAVNLTWASVRGQIYTVQMKNKSAPNAKWEFHPQAINLMGTGGEMRVVDTPPAGIIRQYRLHLFGVKGSSVGGSK